MYSLNSTIHSPPLVGMAEARRGSWVSPGPQQDILLHLELWQERGCLQGGLGVEERGVAGKVALRGCHSIYPELSSQLKWADG